MHNDFQQPAQPLRVKYNDNWGFAAKAMSTRDKKGKNTLLQITQDYSRHNNNNKFGEITSVHDDLEANDGSGTETEISELNLRDEMLVGASPSETTSLSSWVSSRTGRDFASSVPKNKRHFKAKKNDTYSTSESKARDSDISECGLAEELLPFGGTRLTSRYNDDAYSDVQSIRSVQSVVSVPSSRVSSMYPQSMSSESSFHTGRHEVNHQRRKDTFNEISIGDSASLRGSSNSMYLSTDATRMQKNHTRGSRKNSARTSPAGARISNTANSRISYSSSTSPRESIQRTSIPENSETNASPTSYNNPTVSNGSVITRRLSHGNQSVTSTQSRGGPQRVSEQLQGRISKAETDSIGSASSIMMRAQSRLSKSSGSKSINATDPDDEILVGPEKKLHDAARRGDVAVIEQLLNDGVDIDCRNQTERTPLHLAAGNGHVPVLQLMLDRDANIDSSDKFGMSALLWASWFGHKEAVRLLLRAGAKPTSRNKNGYTFLHCAAQNNHLMVEQILIEDLEDFDRDTADDVGRTCLHVLAKYGRKMMLERFIDLKCNVNARDKEGNTPLHLAAKYGFGELIPALVKGGADTEIQNSEKKTPLHLAAEEGKVEAVAALITEEADANAETEDELCPLHLAIDGGHEEAAVELINGGADLDAGNKHNQTPLHYAVLKRHISLVQLLILHNANPNVQDARQESPLHLAAENGQSDITEMLLHSSINLSLRDQRGKSPLEVAARGSFTTVVDMIIKAERHQMYQKVMHGQQHGTNEYESEFSPAAMNISFKPDNMQETQHMRTLLFKLATKHLKRDDWRKLAFHWSFTDSQVCAIEEQYTGDKSFREHGHRMLLIWLNGGLLRGENPTKLLFEGLVAIKRPEVAELMRSKANSIETEKPCTIS